MHELSIISSIVDIAEAQVKKAGVQYVDSIELEIGELAGIEWSALEFAWEVGVQKSVLENAERHIHRIPGRAQCVECGRRFLMKNIFDPCPTCGSYFNEILSGKELRVKALTVS
ncbi:MAG: hydrogenase maturation nickel metallochaperone HypA [Lewinellaceae bacterium]|nr:hydrogenase maturation nickel metallochaperone HypA [Saprospiraceae bacterium]MCB9340422.1 hydrogenase maturation nickel metallochaperone HypA [Lewinellaceae bacterium]